MGIVEPQLKHPSWHPRRIPSIEFNGIPDGTPLIYIQAFSCL
jgi:hypothetical protein